MLTQKFHFFQSLLNLHDAQPESDVEDCPLMRSMEFRNFVIEERGKTLETVKLMAPYFIKYACRPFQLLYDHPDFYIALDYAAYTYYVCFRRLTMIDVDLPDVNPITENDLLDNEAVLNFCSEYLEWLISQCEIHRDWRFAIYRTRKGLHVFPLHCEFLDREERAEFQLQLQSDFYYTIFCYLRQGCSIRISQKHGESAPIYHFVGFLGYGKTNPDLLRLVQFHEHLPDLFCTDSPPLEMK